MTAPVEPIFAELIAQAWQRFGGADTLLPDLPLDAVLVRSSGDDVGPAVARMLELVVLADDPTVPVTVADRLTELGLDQWPQSDRSVVVAVWEMWWRRILAVDPPPWRAVDALAALVRLPITVSAWLTPWLADLEGPAARHLADLIDDGLVASWWDEVPDRRRQVWSWATSEPVVMGMTLVAGPHLAAGRLGTVLDRMLGA